MDKTNFSWISTYHRNYCAVLIFTLPLLLVACGGSGAGGDPQSIDTTSSPPPSSIPPPSGPDNIPPTVTITSPTSNSTHSANNASLNLGGTAFDNVGVTQVTWSNSLGDSGTESVTNNNWNVNGIPLQEGNTDITVTAYDAAGNPSPEDVLSVDYSLGTATNVTLTLAWDPNPAADAVQGYIVYSGPSANSTPLELSDLQVNSGLFDPNAPSMQYNAGINLSLSVGDPVCFWLKAYNNGGYSEYSVSACTTI